ncbi:MAG TPA: SH3 domain-containing protein [Terriglobales bacterium]|nr:SH3 domain-containing protein [Terriglobales bacterium]
MAVGVALLLLAAGCGKTGGKPKEYAYVSAQEAFLRDQVAAVYKKTGKVQNGERVEVLEKYRRFVRVRNDAGEVGWLELRYLTSADVHEQFQKLAAEHAADPVQAPATTRFATNLHVTPDREGEHLYQLKDGAKVELLARATSEKPVPQGGAQPKPVASKKAKEKQEGSAKPMEDWWLVRVPPPPGGSAAARVGWVLARMVDLDVPVEIGQYAEGQRIIAFFVLNQVEDLNKQVPQYVVALNEPRDGSPVDFNQIRVFSWNVKKHRYETAYRERKLQGVLPIRAGQQEFDKEGKLPIFVLRVKDDAGNVDIRTYKLNGVMVRRVLPPGQEKPAARVAPARKRRR